VKKRILTLGITLALVATMVVPTTVLALDPNQTNQSASTFTSAIEIVAKGSDNAVNTIIFGPGTAGGTVSNPFNLTDWVPPAPPPTVWQVLSDTASSPVARLKNTSGGNLQIWFQITDWSNDIVTAEDYELVDPGTTNVAVVDDVLSPDGNARFVRTSVSIGPGAYKDLYLEVVLSATPGIAGSSTLTVLGEGLP